MAQKMMIPETAFPLSRGQKQPRQHEKSHLDFIRVLPCLKCGTVGCEAAHVRYGSLPHGKRETGLGEKPSDCWTVPLCVGDHRMNAYAQHNSNERVWWAHMRIDPLIVAALLFAVSGNVQAGDQIVRAASAGRFWPQ